VLQTDGHFKTELQKVTRKIKDSMPEKTKEGWRLKRIQGKFAHYLEEKLVDKEQSYRWLKFDTLRDKQKVQ
jgi:hypothetical protein